MNEKNIKSLDEFERKYFPKAVEKRSEDEDSPQKIGHLWAKDTIEKFKKSLNVSA